MFYNRRRPTYNPQSPFGEPSMNMLNITDQIHERLTFMEMQLSALMGKPVAPQAFYKPSAQPMYTQPGHTASYFYPTDGFNADAFKKELEPFLSNTGWPSLQHPVIKAMGSEFNTTVYMVYNADGMVYITSDDKIYTSIKNATQLPVTKSNYKNLELHPLFVGIFDKLAELEKSHGQPQHSDNRIDKTALLESILRLTEHKVASLPTITALYACYRWYDCFERDAPLAPSFKEELIKNHTALRKIKERAPYMTQAFKNLEEAFSSLLHHDGSVDFIDSSYPIQSAIHTTVDVLKSLISEKDE
jgi:hypothetical protein